MKCNVFNVSGEKNHIDMLQDHHNQLQRQGCYDIKLSFHGVYISGFLALLLYG